MTRAGLRRQRPPATGPMAPHASLDTDGKRIPQQLSLFDMMLAPFRAPVPPAQAAPPQAPVTPSRPSRPSIPGAADSLPAALPGADPAGGPGSGQRRQLQLNGHLVSWELRRSSRRTIGFVIDDRGLRISAPRWVALGVIENALQEKSDWILRKLVEWRDHAARRERLAPRWEDGAPLRFLGRTLTLHVDPDSRGVSMVGNDLRVGLPADADSERLKDRVQGWLQQQARQVFAERIPVFAQRLGQAPKRWSLSSARTRWGSCNADGSIRLNWRLVHFPPDVIDYVIAHELAHLRELNHGPRFWSTVGELFPEFEQARNWLREYPDEEVR